MILSIFKEIEMKPIYLVEKKYQFFFISTYRQDFRKTSGSIHFDDDKVFAYGHRATVDCDLQSVSVGWVVELASWDVNGRLFGV